MIYEIYDNYIVDIWQMRHMIYEQWYLRYIIPKVNLSVFLLLSQSTIKMVSNDVSVTSLLWRHGALYHAAFYQKPSLRVIPRCVLPKSIIGLYITLRFTKIEMRSLWGQYTNKGHTYVTPSRSRYFMSLHYKWDMIWYRCCDIWYILSQKFLCLCWGLMSQSTIFQSCRDGATASWVINQYFRGVKCLAQGHNTAAVGIEPPTSRSGVRHYPKSMALRNIDTCTW